MTDAELRTEVARLVNRAGDYLIGAEDARRRGLHPMTVGCWLRESRQTRGQIMYLTMYLYRLPIGLAFARSMLMILRQSQQIRAAEQSRVNAA